MAGWKELQRILDRETVDPLDIVNEFATRPPEQQPCPIGRDDYWLKKLCALADELAKTSMDRKRIIDQYKASVEDLAKEYSRLAAENAQLRARWIGPGMPDCEAGCRPFTGGEWRHTPGCKHYPDSLSYLLDKLEQQH